MLAHLEAVCKKAGRSIQEFSIGWEKHDPKKKNYDPKRPFHWHLYFKTANGEPLNATTPRYFDAPFLAESGSEVHPNMRTAKKGLKDTIRIVRYTRKDGHWLSNMGEMSALPEEKKSKAELATEAFAVLNDETKTKQERRREYNELIKEADPLKYAYDGARADATAVRILGASDKSNLMDDFLIPPITRKFIGEIRQKGYGPKQWCYWQRAKSTA